MQEAFKIAEIEGIEAVTSRRIASSIGCSIQPIFSHFPTMDILRQETFDYACQIFVNEILTFEDHPNFFQLSTNWVISLSRNKPYLFKLLYLSKGFKGNSMIDIMLNNKSNNKAIKKMMTSYSLDENSCKSILLRAYLMLIGIGTMICINKIEFDDTQVESIMKQTVSDMVIGCKETTL